MVNICLLLIALEWEIGTIYGKAGSYFSDFEQTSFFKDDIYCL